MAKLKTGRHTGALKARRQAKKRTLHNKGVKKTLRVLYKDLSLMLEQKNAGKAGSLYSQISSALDKAARKGVLHWKAAARKKSRLAGRLRGLLAPAASPQQ